jgi:uncharacterized membrane protein YeaQ/YmgE (transglycosylase-associated protein family)
MYPIAGVVLWIFFGAVVGWVAGKVTGTEEPNRSMANMGVGMTTAAIAGWAVTFFSGGDPGGFTLALVCAILTSCFAVAAFRAMYRGRSSTLR